MKPELSIVIANLSGMPEIGWCLAALEKEQQQVAVEVIVVQPSKNADLNHTLHKLFPWAHLLQLDKDFSIPEMHNFGLEYSQGEIIAILEDHEIVLPGWIEAVIESHITYPEVAAIAGPIDNGSTGQIIDWATFFCEYCRFMPPVQQGTANFIPGNNVSYKRWALETVSRDEFIKGFWENNLHVALLKRGYKFRMEPGLQVSHQKHIGFFEFLQERYHYSHLYANSRMNDRALLFRMAYSLACMILPVVLMKRILFCGISKHRFYKELVLSIPLLFCFTAVWAFGEMVGSLFGTGRNLTLIIK